MSLLPVGTVLDGTYRLVRVVGEGGMGVVYEATHARLAGRYAIKVLLPNISRSPDALARFECEARVTSALQHPNVVQVVDHNTAADGTEYLVMEYLAGESLAQRLARTGPLPLDAVVRIIDELAAGLAAAHALGVVHRDLKPDNVFLVPVEGREHELVKILDFGISKASWVQAADGEICGTPQYMAPEQVRGAHAEVDGATDQFALAVIAYELLTGRNPFIADTIEETFARVLREDPAPTAISPEIDGVLARGFSKVKADRFASVTELAETLRAVAAMYATTYASSLRPTPPAGMGALPAGLALSDDHPASVAGELSAVDIDLAALGLRPRWRRWSGAVAVAVVAASLSLPWAVGAAPHRFAWARSALVTVKGAMPTRAAATATAAPVAATPPAVPLPSVVSEVPRDGSRAIVVAERDAVATSPTPNPAQVQVTQLQVTQLQATATHGSRPRHSSDSKATPRAQRHRSVLPPDEDATMPLDDSFGIAP